MRSHVDVVKQAFRAFDRRDVDGMLALADPELEFWALTAEALGRQEPYRGHEGMRRYFADAAAVWEELRPIPAEFQEYGEWVVVTGRVYARGGGRVVDSSAGWHWRVRDGLLVYGRAFHSSEEARDTPLGEAPAT